MGKRLKKLKKIRLHHEGTHTLVWGALGLTALNLAALMLFECKTVFQVCLLVSIVLYLVLVNFFQCPIRIFSGDTERVVVEEVEEREYFRDKRIMVSIFMSLFNVHANWVPVDGKVKLVRHQDGNFHKAWLPKASEENERSTVVITTPDGRDILVRQIAGAMARRIVTYTKEGEECFIDEHLGFIKFGSRVDVYLPLGTDVKVSLNQKTVGNETIIAKLSKI